MSVNVLFENRHLSGAWLTPFRGSFQDFQQADPSFFVWRFAPTRTLKSLLFLGAYVTANAGRMTGLDHIQRQSGVGGGGAIIQITLAVFYWDQHVLIASDGTSCSCSIRKNRLFCWFSWWTFNKVTQNGSLKRLQFFLSFSTGHFIMFGWSRFNNTLSEVSCLRTQHQGSNLDHSIWRQTHN